MAKTATKTTLKLVASGGVPTDRRQELSSILLDIKAAKLALSNALHNAQVTREQRNFQISKAARFKAEAAAVADPLEWADLTAQQQEAETTASKREAEALEHDAKATALQTKITRLRSRIMQIRKAAPDPTLHVEDVRAIMHDLVRQTPFGKTAVSKILATEGNGALCVSALSPEYFGVVAAAAIERMKSAK